MSVDVGSPDERRADLLLLWVEGERQLASFHSAADFGDGPYILGVIHQG